MQKILNYSLDFLGLALLIVIIALPVSIVVNLNPKLDNKPKVLGASTQDQLIAVEMNSIDSVDITKLIVQNRSMEFRYKVDNVKSNSKSKIATITNVSSQEINLKLDMNSDEIWFDDQSNTSNENGYILKPGQKTNIGLSFEGDDHLNYFVSVTAH